MRMSGTFQVTLCTFKGRRRLDPGPVAAASDDFSASAGRSTDLSYRDMHISAMC
jgi:hypothetical protein